jgi:hypothetical protein
MAFVKVVEGSEIYNFPIHHLVHFYSKFWSFTCSNSGRVKRIRASRCRAAPARRTASASGPPRLCEAAHLPRIPAYQSVLKSACHAPPRRSHGTCALCTERTAGPSAARSPGRAPTEAAAILRRHLRRHPVVTGEHAPFLRPSTPPPSRVRQTIAAPAAPPRPPWPPPSKLPPLLTLLATAHESISLGTDSTFSGHALPGVAPLSPEPQAAAAGADCYRHVPSLGQP